MELREYEQAKFALADILRSAATLLRVDHDSDLEGRLRGLFVRLAEDRFNLVFIGRFNRGKSSLMNAILGTDRLPTGIVPLTSVITTVSYGTSEKVTLRYQQKSHLDIPIRIDELASYITQQGNPGNALGIATADIELPAQILRRSFYLVDTPGLGSAIAENTLTTQSFLPEADAIVFVTSYESPLSDDELSCLQTVGSDLDVFVVINKADLVSDQERRDVEGFVGEQLRARFGAAAPHVFSVSARDAITAKLSSNRSLLAASGMPSFEARLTSVLIEHKRGLFLARMCERISRLLEGAPSSEGIAGLLARTDEVAKAFGGGKGNSQAASKSEDASFGLHQLRPCEICAKVSDASWEFLRRYQYRLTVDGGERTRFAARRGFCPSHTWEYHSVASPHGTCVGFPPLLDRLAAQLRKAAAPTSTIGPAQLEPDIGCVLCTVRDKAEARAVASLAGQLRKALHPTLSGLSAICLPHLAMLASVLEDEPSSLRALAAHHADLVERVAEDMRSFALKHDALRRNLQTKEEQTAAERALLLLAGSRNVNNKVGTGMKRRLAMSFERRNEVSADAVQPEA